MASPARLPKLELVIYLIIWICIFFYGLYRIKLSGDELAKNNSTEEDYGPTIYLQPGWISGRKKDYSDMEWNTWIVYIAEIGPWILLHLFISELVRWFDVDALPLAHFFVFLSCMVFNVNAFTASIFMVMLIPYFIIILLELKILIWPVGICFIVYTHVISDPFLIYRQKHGLLLMWSIGWFHLKCIDFTLRETKSKNEKVKKCLNFIGYAFYLPNFYQGPFIPYEIFIKGFRRSFEPWTIHRFKMFFLDVLRLTMYAVVFEIMLHYLYCQLMSLYSIDGLLTFGSATINGLGLCLSQYFYLKYVIMYGFSNAISKAERYEPPTQPICVNRVFYYSNMWRYFDRGFYYFIFNNIYKPLTTKDMKLFYRLCVSFLCFSFVYVWHGINHLIFTWSVLNFLVISIEAYGKILKNSHYIKKLENIIGPRNLRRLTGVVTTPLWMLAVTSNFLFFGGMDLGFYLLKQFIYQEWSVYIFLHFLGYCMYHICAEATAALEKKIHKKSE